jgi:hypothetical protein
MDRFFQSRVATYQPLSKEKGRTRLNAAFE